MRYTEIAERGNEMYEETKRRYVEIDGVVKGGILSCWVCPCHDNYLRWCRHPKGDFRVWGKECNPFPKECPLREVEE